MLRETTATVRRAPSECDCGILDEVVDGLDAVVNKGEEETVTEEGGRDDEAQIVTPITLDYCNLLSLSTTHTYTKRDLDLGLGSEF